MEVRQMRLTGLGMCAIAVVAGGPFLAEAWNTFPIWNAVSWQSVCEFLCYAVTAGFGVTVLIAEELPDES